MRCIWHRSAQLLHVLLRKRRSEVQYKVEHRPETLAEAVKKAHLRSSSPRPITIFARQLLRINSRSGQPDEDQYVRRDNKWDQKCREKTQWKFPQSVHRLPVL